ncbi:MAG: hypothetical protein HY513_02805 [Candidatus Aenigmarchaeota archaeon]|nr:hypothetical protein [Candidatus Aenigmarchaeota archaeon]
MKIKQMWKRSNGISGVQTHSDFKKSICIFSASKILILVVGILATLLIPIELTHRQTAIDNWFLNSWAQYDARAYLDIAENGYNSQFPGGGNYAWYPLYPLMIKIFASAVAFIGVSFSFSYGLSAFLISNIFSFVAVYYLYKLTNQEFGNSKIAKRSVIYFSLFPTVYFLTAMYAESLLIALSIASFYYAKNERWFLASLTGFFAGMTRIQGAFLFFPISYMYFRSKEYKIKNIKANGCFLMLPLTGSAVVMLYHYIITGNAFIQFSTQAAYGRVLSLPWDSFMSAVLKIANATSLQDIFYHVFNIFMALGFLALAAWSFKEMKKEYGIYFLISMIVPLSSTALLSISRHNLAMFPAFMLMAKLSEKRKYRLIFAPLYVIFFVLLIFFTARHVNEWFIFNLI